MHNPSLAQGGTLAGWETETLALEDDQALVAAARNDPAAFSELYRRYVTRVYRYLYSHVGQAADAEDLTAQVFIAAWEGMPRYREQGHFAAWLFSIVRHKTNDFYRRQRSLLSLEEAQSLLQENWDPLDQIEQEEAMKTLAALVAGLAPEQCELLRLRFAADLSYAQIAAILGRSEASVKMAVHRLLRGLQVEWEKRNG